MSNLTSNTSGLQEILNTVNELPKMDPNNVYTKDEINTIINNIMPRATISNNTLVIDGVINDVTVNNNVLEIS